MKDLKRTATGWRTVWRPWNVRVLTALWLAGFAGMVLATDLTFAWDPNPESDLAGYRLYYRSGGETNFTVVETGNVTRYTVPDLVPGMTYDFHLTAYNQIGLESEPSNTVTVPIDPAGPQLMEVRLTAEGPEFKWPATPGRQYLILYKDDLAESVWQELVTVNAATDPQVFRDYSTGPGEDPLVFTNPRRFYRIVEQP